MSKFTPGPWLARQFHTGRGAVHGWWVIDSIPDHDGRIVANAICQVSATNDDAEDNAKLIAASTDLLAACQAVAGWMESFSMPPTSTIEEKQQHLAILEAAIAKATGK